MRQWPFWRNIAVNRVSLYVGWASEADPKKTLVMNPAGLNKEIA